MAKAIKPRKQYFKGWYIKQSGECTVSLIPAFHADKKSVSASVQIITADKSYFINLGKINKLQYSDKPFNVNINGNIFSEEGVYLNSDTNKVKIEARLKFTAFNYLKSDIMGPFTNVPFMQCKHGIISMYHNVNGYIILNNEKYTFTYADGYIETDSGRSFPDKYLWTQAGGKDKENEPFSVMFSIAKIPFMFFNFTGCICAILFKGKQYILATYKGAKVIVFNKDNAVIKQGKFKMQISLLHENNASCLNAPVNGIMKRIIKESVCCSVRYIFTEEEKLIFDYIAENAGFEFSDINNNL